MDATTGIYEKMVALFARVASNGYEEMHHEAMAHNDTIKEYHDIGILLVNCLSLKEEHKTLRWFYQSTQVIL